MWWRNHWKSAGFHGCAWFGSLARLFRKPCKFMDFMIFNYFAATSAPLIQHANPRKPCNFRSLCCRGLCPLSSNTVQICSNLQIFKAIRFLWFPNCGICSQAAKKPAAYLRKSMRPNSQKSSITQNHPNMEISRVLLGFGRWQEPPPHFENHWKHYEFQSFLDRWGATGAPPNAFKSLKTCWFL